MIANRRWSIQPKDIRNFVIVAAIATIAPLAMGNVRTFMGSHGQILATDFSVFRFAAILLWQGDIGTIFNPEKFDAARTAFEHAPVGFSPFPYPPNALWFVAPLVVLPAMLALLVWLGITFAAFAWPIARQTPTLRASALALLAAPGSLVCISFGQNGFLSGALLGGGLLALERRPVLAGCLFGLLSYKPQFGVLLPFVLLAGRHTTAFLTAAAVTIATIGGSVLVFGISPWTEYLSGAVAVQRAFLETGGGPAILTSPSFFIAGRILGLPIVLAYALQAIASLCVIGACIRVFARRSGDAVLKAALVMIGAFLVTPYSSSSDLCIVAAAQILAFSRGAPKGSAAPWLQGLVWLLPLVMLPLGVAHIPVAPFALGALFYLLMRDILSPQEERTDRAAAAAATAP